MKENLRLGFTLLMICLVAGLALAFANNATADIIAQNSKLNKADLSELLPGADNIKEISGAVEGTIIKEAFEAYSGDALAGYVIKVSPKGFKGDIDLMLAINTDDVITGIKVVAHTETPGLGAKIDLPEYKEKFKSLSIENELKSVKTAKAADNEVEAISGATVTSNAVVSGINEAIKYYKEAVKGEEVIEVLVSEVEEIKEGDKLLKYRLISAGEGFYGEIKVATTIDIESNSIATIEVIEQDETPDLGGKVVEAEFTDRFIGKSVEGAVQVDIISGATYSSDGVIEAVNKAIEYFNTELKGR